MLKYVLIIYLGRRNYININNFGFINRKKYATESVMSVLFRNASYKSYAFIKQIICFSAYIL